MGTTRPGPWALYQPKITDLVKPASNDYPAMLASIEGALSLGRSFAAQDTAKIAAGILASTTTTFSAWMNPLPDNPSAVVSTVTVDVRNRILSYTLDDGAQHVAAWTPGTGQAIARSRATWNSLVAYGDSITQSVGWGSSPNTVAWPDVTAARLGTEDVTNLGIAGWTSTELAVLYGALPLDLIIPSGSIPATGTTACTTVQNGSWNDQTRQWSGRILVDNAWHPVILHKVPTRGQAPDAIEQTGATAALTVPPTAPVRFLADAPETQMEKPAVFMWGRNNMTTWSLPVIQRDTLALARMLDAHQTPWVAMTLTNRSSEPSGSTDYNNVIAYNDWLITTWPRNTFDARSYLIKYGLALAGITPTAADTTAIAEDRIPPSLLWDASVHPNDAGETVIGQGVADVIKTIGVMP